MDADSNRSSGNGLPQSSPTTTKAKLLIGDVRARAGVVELVAERFPRETLDDIGSILERRGFHEPSSEELLVARMVALVIATSYLASLAHIARRELRDQAEDGRHGQLVDGLDSLYVEAWAYEALQPAGLALEGWLYLINRHLGRRAQINRMIDAGRHAARARRLIPAYVEAISPPEPPSDAEVRRAIARESLDAIKKKIPDFEARFPRVDMHNALGMPFAEIALALAEPIEATRAAYRREIREIRRALGLE